MNNNYGTAARIAHNVSCAREELEIAARAIETAQSHLERVKTFNVLDVNWEIQGTNEIIRQIALLDIQLSNLQ